MVTRLIVISRHNLAEQTCGVARASDHTARSVVLLSNMIFLSYYGRQRGGRQPFGFL
jgi:hypothetical protein